MDSPQSSAREHEIWTAQVRLLYRNAHVGTRVTLVCSSILAYLEWPVIAHHVILSWSAYMIAVAAGRSWLARRYHAAREEHQARRGWHTAFLTGATLAA